MEKTKKLILQVGESTHTHVLESEKDIEFTRGVEDEITFMLHSAGILTHEEHPKMVFPPGEYVKFPQVEYDPLSGNIRQVFD